VYLLHDLVCTNKDDKCSDRIKNRNIVKFVKFFSHVNKEYRNDLHEENFKILIISCLNAVLFFLYNLSRGQAKENISLILFSLVRPGT